MPVGVIVNALSVLLGGIVGTLLGKRIPEDLKNNLTIVFGCSSIAMGATTIVRMENMPAVIFSLIIGTAIGTLLHLAQLIEKGARLMQKPLAGISSVSPDDEAAMAMLITIIILFCTSGTGIYGSIDSGMTGNHTILLTKSILDFFTAMIFASQLGIVISAISVPQVIIFLLLFFLAKFIYPLTNPAMIADFKACGGILLLATGFNIMKLKKMPLPAMLPAMVLVMPVSWAWMTFILPLFG